MEQSTYDPCFLHTRKNGFAVLGLQTDDTLILADEVAAVTGRVVSLTLRTLTLRRGHSFLGDN